MFMERVEMPMSVKAVLWSYDTDKLDLKRDRARIVTSVLNLGTFAAVEWLRSTYSKEEIAEVIRNTKPGEWSARSLNLWSLVYNTPAHVRERFS